LSVFPYWILFSLFAAGAVQYRPDPRRLIQGGPLLLAMALVTMVMIGFRYEVGGDWLNYIDILHDITENGLWGPRAQDPGYGLLNLLAGMSGLGIWAVNLACAVLFTWGLVKFARRQPNPWLVMVVSVPYLIIVVAMGYTRQAVAIGFILAGLADLERGTVFRFAFYMLLATTFHKSAVVVVPLVALTASKNRFMTGAMLLMTAVLLYYLFVQASVDKLMTNYVGAEYQSQGAAVRVAMNLPPAVLFLVFRRRFQLSLQQDKLWRNFSLGALLALAMLLFTNSSTAVDRLALYLIPLQMFVLGRLPTAFPDRGRLNAQLAFLVIAYSAAIQFVWLNYAANADSWLPYKLSVSNSDEGSSQ
jgi:hypothetical protein